MSMIYLNNAATSWPKPQCVAEAMKTSIENIPHEHFRGGIQDHDVFTEVRNALLPVLGVRDPNQIALGPNATWALNQAIMGLNLRAGDTVITTKAEHNSVLRPLHRLEMQGVRVIYLDTDSFGRMNPDRWEQASIKWRPKLSVFTHASNVTGAVSDMKRLCKISKEYNSIILVDCSQTIGCIPVFSEEWGADLVAFTGHKYLLGPQGTGGLWIRNGLTLAPYLTGGTGIHSDDPNMPIQMPIRLEAGTGNEPGFEGLLAALDWNRKNPLDNHDLFKKADYLCKNLANSGVNVINPPEPRTPVVSFTIPGLSVSDAGYMLKEGSSIVCRTGLHCAPMIFSCLNVPETIRFSLSRFTAYSELDAAVQAVEAILP